MEAAMIGLLGVIVGASLTALLTATKDWWFHSIKKKEEQTYLAIQISCLLERFVSGCVEVAYDDGLCHGQRDEQGCLTVQVPTPSFEPLSVDVNWKSLPTDLMYQILRLPSQIDDANAYISAAWEYAADPPDFEELFEAREEKYSALGLQAIKLINDLREIADLPSEPESERWNPQGRLQDAQNKVTAVIAERDKHNQKILKEMSDTSKLQNEN